MNRAVLALVFLALPAGAQNPKTRPTVDDDLQRNITYEFQNVDQVRGAEITQFVGKLLPQSVFLEYSMSMRTVIIKSFNPGDADKVIALLKKYDTPPPPKPEIEFTAYLVMASTPTSAQRQLLQVQPRSEAPPPPVPAELQSALTQMKQTLADRTYSLRDTIVMKVTGPAEYDGVLPGFGFNYALAFGNVTVSKDGKSVSLQPFRFSMTPPCESKDCPRVGIETETVIHEGQKQVFGKMPMQPQHSSSPGDLFVVLTAKIQ